MVKEEVVFQIILHGGNARSQAMEAITLAKEGDITTAREKLKEADKEMAEAHQTQTDLIQKEAAGEETKVSLLLAHAQDHFMNALTVKDMAKEFVDLYEKLAISQEVNAK